MRKDKLPPFYKKWAYKSLWSPIEAAYLIGELDDSYLERTPQSFWGIDLEKEKNCNEAFVLKFFDLSFGDYLHPFSWIDKCIFYEIKIPRKLESAIKKVFLKCYLDNPNLPKDYPQIARKFKLKLDSITEAPQTTAPHISNSIPTCLNEEHINFAYELQVAINAWTALLSDPNKKINKSVAAALESWMKANKIHIKSPNFVKRIATIITPVYRKSGGIPSTSNKSK